MSGRGGIIKHPHHHNLRQWDAVIPPECHPSPSILRRGCMKRGRESVKMVKGSEIRALLWFQGESDAGAEDKARDYRVNMEKFIHDHVREDLHLPSLPIIQVALASGDDRYIEIVREAQEGINLPNVVCVDAKGLQLREEDNLHLTTEAQVQLGHMLADAYLSHFVAAP